MNTQAVRHEFQQFLSDSFNNEDMNIMTELSEIFIQSHHGPLVAGDERTIDGLNLAVDLS